jgi:hypothetical protein
MANPGFSLDRKSLWQRDLRSIAHARAASRRRFDQYEANFIVGLIALVRMGLTLSRARASLWFSCWRVADDRKCSR